MKLAGRTAIVTGAASGIGLASATLFAQQGARVVAVAIAAEPLRELQADHARLVALVADVSTREGVECVLEAAHEPDILFNNAGILDGISLVDETTDELWAKVIAINLTAPFMLSRGVLPGMVARGRGSIVNTSSIAASHGARGGAAYTASKAGLLGLTRSIAATYAHTGVRCNAICPGGVETGMSKAVDGLSERGVMLMVKEAKPPRARPEEIAQIALFLASDAASQINGVALSADGGWSAR